jgi:small conductance mechanosensitive channel
MESLFSPEFWQMMGKRAVEWTVTTVPSIVVIIVLAIILFRFLSFSVKRIRNIMIHRIQTREQEDAREIEKRVETLIGILTMGARIVIWIILLMLLLRKIGIDIAPLIAGAGIAGLALGFGAQELVRDVISGFFILLENEVRNGDVAIVNGTGGLVENIGLRTISLRDLSGVVHIFQNGKIDTLSNMTKGWSAVVFDIGVAYKEDTDRVVEAMLRVAADMREDPEYREKILEEMEIFGVDKFSDSAVIIKARFKTKPIQQWAVAREYRRRLKKLFDSEGIEIPFPHQTIYWGEEIKPLELTYSDSPRGRAPAKGD